MCEIIKEYRVKDKNLDKTLNELDYDEDFGFGKDKVQWIKLPNKLQELSKCRIYLSNHCLPLDFLLHLFVCLLH